MDQKDFCVIVPAYNEEKVIASSLRSLKKVFNQEDIYVVSDGSTDRTAEIAYKEEVTVLSLASNRGKAAAQECVISAFALTKRYRYVLFADADSQLDQNFLNEAKVFLKEDPALIVGTVKSLRKGFISAFRTYEYGISYRIYKNAQNIMRTITVAPGCASLYKSSVLEKLELRTNTLTEDFDLTIQIYKKNLGRIIYARKAVVVTQDPINLKDYWKQVLRWNIGTWQNYFKYELFKFNSKYSIELNFLFFDNFVWLFSMIIAVLSPSLLLHTFIGVYLTINLFSLYIAFIEKKAWIIPYIPIFPLFYTINITAYFFALAKVLTNKNWSKSFSWNKVRRY